MKKAKYNHFQTLKCSPKSLKQFATYEANLLFCFGSVGILHVGFNLK